MKKGITLAMCLAFVACGMLAAGCTEEHVHNWSSDWTSDSTGHWQTCDGCDEKNESAAHSGGTATCTEKAECEVCGEAYGELAAHSYTVIKSDEDSHWLECLCGAKDEASDEAHSGGTANCQQGAICGDCGLEYTAVGSHAYTIPSGDDTQHWLECVCGDKDTNTLGDHTGGEATCTNKAECGTCGMPYGALAAHEYTVEGSDATQHWMECACGAKDESTVVDHAYTVAGSDENKHWNACACGAKDPASEGAHTAANAVGQCDTCGYQINEYSIEDILEMIEDNASKVKMGTTTHNTKTDVINASETNIYEYRNGYLYIQNFGQLFEDYNTIKSDGTPFSIRVSAPDTDNGETEPKIAVNPYGCTLDDVRGFRFDPVIIDDIMSFYGAEELILNLYDEAQYNDNGDLAVSFKLEGGKIVAAYKFGYYDVDGYFFYLTVDFTLAADGWLETVDVYSYKYGAGKYEKDGEYYVATGKADYIYHITVTQSNECENADVENPYAPEKIYVQSFDLMTAATGGTALGDVLEVEAATSQIKYYLQNVTPSTAVAELNPVTFEIDGETIGFFDTRLMVNYSKEGGYIGIRPNQLVGEYPLTIKVGDASKTVLVKVLAATPTSLTANVFDGTVYNKTTTASTYEGMNVRFNAVANVAYADASFTAEITSTNAADATLTWDSEAGEYVFNSATVGQYTIKLTSSKAPSVTSTLTVSVNELPDVASILSGEYEYAMDLGGEPYVVYTAAFTPDTTAEGISGTVDVTWNGQGTVVYAYTYDAENGLQLTKTGGVDMTVTIGLSTEFALYIENNGSQYALTKKTAGGDEGGDEEDDKSPMYSYAVILSGVHSQGFNLGGTLYQNAIVTFNPGEMTDTKLTGMLTVKDPNAKNAEYEFSYEYTVDGGFVATSATDFSSADYSYTVTLDSNLAIVVTKTKNGGSTNTFTCTQESSAPDAYTVGGGSSEGGEGEEGATSGTISVTTTDTYTYEVDEYTFTAPAAGKYTFTVPAGLGVFSQAAKDAWGNAEVDYYGNTDGASFSVELAAGEEFVYWVGAMTKADWEITWTYEEVSEEPSETSGTISVTTTDTYTYDVDKYTFTAPAAGTYSFYVPAGLGFYSKTAYDAYGPAELDFMENTDGGYVEVTLAAGEEYVFHVGSETKADWTITWSIKAEEEGGDVTPSSKQLVLGENSISVTADDITAGAIDYTLVVTKEGTYSFASNALMAVINFADGSTQRGQAYLTAGTYTINVVTAYTSGAGTYTMTVTYEAPVQETVLVLGENNIVVSEDDITAGGIDYTFEVTEEGTYSFASNALMAVINFADGSTQRGQAYLTAGTYTIGVVTAYVSGAGTYTMTVTYEAPVVESEPDGSEENPYVWDTFPESLVVTESNPSSFTYYTFTVTEANIYVFTFDTSDTWYNLANAEGTVITSGYQKESFEADLAVGTYRIALGNWDVAAPLTVTASVKEVTGGGEGTETAGTAIRLTLNGKYAGAWSSSSKIALVADQASAVTYYMEDAGDGNYYIYFLTDGVAQYLYLNNANMSASIGTTTDKATAHTWTFDAENQKIVNTTYTSRALYYHTSDGYMRAYSIDAADAASKAWTWYEAV